jgi:glycosyltransferase involved in cell wall biosynthesis
MRVLHLLDPAVLRRTDYRCRTLALVDQLRAQGVQTVQLAAPGPFRLLDIPAADEPDPEGRHVYRTAARARPAWLPPACAPLLSAAALALRLRQVARLTRPDLIHVHAPPWHAVAACGRLPLVAEAERRGHSKLAAVSLPAWERWALARTGALAAPSMEMRAALRGAGLGGRRIAVIPPAADLAADLAGTASPARRPAGLEGAPLLAYAGRLDRDDGIDLLLAVLPGLRKRYPALRLVVAGGGLREDELLGCIAASGARGHVVLTGPLPSRRAADVLPRADIAVFPALPGGAAELAPSRHLLNAMAQGCAIVASDIACHRELLVHGHSAMLFRAGSGKALAEALLGLLDRPVHQRALGAAVASHAATRHSWTRTAASYRRLYETVLAEHEPHRKR